MSDPATPPRDEHWLYGRLTLTDAVYVGLCSMFVVVLVLTNIIGVKLFVLFPGWTPPWAESPGLVLTSGIVTYPITFLLTDVVSELWGRARANLMVVLGFLMSMVMLGVVLLARALPPASIWTNPDYGFDTAVAMQRAFDANFSYPGILLGASMLAYLVAQLFDVRLYHFWWRLTKGRHMWLRNNGSTAISQLVDTIIVNGIFLHFGLGLDAGTIISIIISVYLCKLMLAACDTPLIYLVIGWLRRVFGLGHDAAPQHAPLV